MTMYKNFTLAELTASDTAQKLGIDNTPPVEAIAHLGELCGTILQPLRDAWGRPIRVTSGYRCAKLNKAVGGSNSSAHLQGYAADIQCQNMEDFPFFVDFVRAFMGTGGMKWDQIIIEQSGASRWIHIGVRNLKGEQRMQLFGMKI